MFDGIQERLQDVFRRLKGEGRVNEETLNAALREIRLALLEADVHFKVVKSFVASIREKALGEEVLKSLTPAQQVIKIVRDEMVELLGSTAEEPKLAARPAVVMLCGLQGSGKTTTAGKLANRWRNAGRRPLLVAADLQRAAAVEQLRQVGAALDVPVLAPEGSEDVHGLAQRARKEASARGADVVIFDTAGRLHIDKGLMTELVQLQHALEPEEVFFVADAMTGQDAVKSAGAFAEALELSGAILTKLDGDSRGGAALSVRAVTGVPVRYAGVGEKLDELELFHPDRMASRILGMGDVLSLIEKAEEGIDKEEAERLAQNIAKRELTLEDVRDQLRQLRKLGPLGQVLEMLPKAGPLKGLDPGAVDESELTRIEAIIDSMTPQERRHPKILSGSRKKRVAKGSGTRVQDVNQLLKRHRMMKKMLKGVKGKWMRQALGR